MVQLCKYSFLEFGNRKKTSCITFYAPVAEYISGKLMLSFLSVVLKHFNHILVATNELAASVQHSGV